VCVCIETGKCRTGDDKKAARGTEGSRRVEEANREAVAGDREGRDGSGDKDQSAGGRRGEVAGEGTHSQKYALYCLYIVHV
jgi:hypothetical protein